VADSGLQQGDGPEDIDARVEDGIGNRPPDARLGREMDHSVGLLDREQLVQPGRVQLHLVKAGGGMNLRHSAGGQVVQDDQLVAVAGEPVADMGADESRSSGDQDFQWCRVMRNVTSPMATRLQ